MTRPWIVTLKFIRIPAPQTERMNTVARTLLDFPPTWRTKNRFLSKVACLRLKQIPLLFCYFEQICLWVAPKFFTTSNKFPLLLRCIAGKSGNSGWMNRHIQLSILVFLRTSCMQSRSQDDICLFFFVVHYCMPMGNLHFGLKKYTEYVIFFINKNKQVTTLNLLFSNKFVLCETCYILEYFYSN